MLSMHLKRKQGRIDIIKTDNVEYWIALEPESTYEV